MALEAHLLDMVLSPVLKTERVCGLVATAVLEVGGSVAAVPGVEDWTAHCFVLGGDW